MQASNAVDITSRTWAVRPQSESLTSPPPLPDWQLALNGSSESSRRSPSAGPQDKEYSSGDDSDTPKPRKAQKSTAESRLAYKPSFSKATFQWMRGELLGKGSYGQVYLALNATTGEIMAVKQVEFPKTPSDRIKSHQLDVMKALKFESDTLKDLDHANIVQYLGYEESEDFLSIFLEYVPGGTISELLRQHGRFREEVTTSFLRQILQGLDYLHSSNILHRDLKADNILVEESGVCKISDFGISKKADDLYHRGRAYTMMKGTVYWMAPEVLSSDGYDAKVDIWSVGCVAVEMWTGTRPWSGYQTTPVMYKLYQEKQGPPIPSDISMSPLANDFRENCFHTDPRQRPHARTLKKHPYLQQPTKGWVFDITDIADSHRHRRPPAIPEYSYPSLYPDKNNPRSSRDSSSTLRPSQPSTKGTARPNLPTLSIPEFPVQTLTQERSRAAEPPSGTLGPGPPLVTITPPGSPKSQPKEYRYLPYSASEVTTSSRRIRPRKLIVANPDQGSDELRRSRVSRKPTFIYTPPPLPDPALQPTSATSPSKTPVSVHGSSYASTRIPHAAHSPSLSSSPPSAQVEHGSKLPERARSTSTHVPSSAISPSLSSSPPSALVEPPSSSNRPLTSKPSVRSPRPLPPSPAGHATSTTSATATTHQPTYHSSRDRPHTASSSSSSHHPLPLPQSSAASRHGYGTAYKAAHSTSSTSTSSISISSCSSSTTALGKPTARPLPMSPPRKLRTSNSVAHLPGSSGNRMLMKQKSVPDVSIFAFDPAAQRSGGKSFSMDSELEDEFEELMAGNNAGRAGGTTSISNGRSRYTPATTTNTIGNSKNGGRQRESTTSITMRPKMEEVVEHLESWFPNHDLDQPVGDPGSSSTTTGLTRPSSSNSSSSGSSSQQTDQQQLIRQQQLQQQQQRKADGRKSIRMIAKEQARKSHGDPSRRRTRLWNSSVKELKHQP